MLGHRIWKRGWKTSEEKGGDQHLAKQFDPRAAHLAVEMLDSALAEARKEAPDAIERLCTTWKRAYVDCGHKALGRLMIGKSVDDACRSFEK